MAHPLDRFITMAVYAATQLPRVAWYVAHGAAMDRLWQQAIREKPSKLRGSASPHARFPDRSRLYADMVRLFRQDLANVEAGIYPLPADHDGSLATLLDRSRLFFEDLPSVHRRRESGAHSEILNEETRGKRPRYYLQNFHFQTGGWMTEDSAQRYDTQVEVLFKGAANAIRRQAVPQLHDVFAGRDQRRLRLVDVGCGTGRFLDFVKQAWPRLPVLGLDLSEAYVREARRHVGRWSRIGFFVANAESIPLPNESQDGVTNIFMFHELPPTVRRVVFREMARVLKRGGRLVLIDSLQRGDEPDYEGLLDWFPQRLHEPYYASYIEEDFAAIAASCGLRHSRDVRAFVSKVMVFDKVP